VEVGQNKDLVCYRKKQSFRQCACELGQLVLKPGFRLKERALGNEEKSENFNSLRPILFKLCKKNYRGGQTDPPPPPQKCPLHITYLYIYSMLPKETKMFLASSELYSMLKKILVIFQSRKV